MRACLGGSQVWVYSVGSCQYGGLQAGAVGVERACLLVSGLPLWLVAVGAEGRAAIEVHACKGG